MNPIVNPESDKSFWHGYLPFYESLFVGRDIQTIAEIGVFRGASIRWLHERFPSASIIGGDKDVQSERWPVGDWVSYQQMDQESNEQVAEFFSRGPFDLIIDDGSHFPVHQVRCLLAGLSALRSGGIYIVEDIHTSHPDHEYSVQLGRCGNALHVLLALDHYQRIGVPVEGDVSGRIAHESLFSVGDVERMAREIDSYHLYRRTCLPDYCSRCGSRDFNYHFFECVCGQAVFSHTDSMAFAVVKAG